MLRLNRNENVVRTLRNRELGLVCSPQKLTVNVLYQLVTCDTRNFLLTYKRNSSRRIHFESGKLFLENFSICLSVWGYGNQPTTCFQLEKSEDRGKVVDVLLASYGSGYQRITDGDMKCQAFQGYFLVLFKNNWLHSFHPETGALQKRIYLGKTHDIAQNFKHCDWDIVGKQITLMTNINNAILILIAVFTVAPLEFRALMLVHKKLFGPHCKKINVSDSLLIVGLGSLSNGSVHLYSFIDILDENISFSAKLGEVCQEFDNQAVGSYPAGIPINCIVKQLPPILFVVNCSNFDVAFGGHPWHYLITPPKHSSVFDVRKVADHTLAINGKIADPKFGFDEDMAHFHNDNSERVIHVSPHAVHIYKLLSDSSPLTRVEISYKMTFIDVNAPKRIISSKTNRQLRVKPVQSDWPDVKTVYSMDYEDELDLFVILGFNTDSHSCLNRTDSQTDAIESIAKVNYYDNFQGHLVRSHYLAPLYINEFNDYVLNFTLDTLIVLVRSSNRFKCYIFKLMDQNCLS